MASPVMSFIRKLILIGDGLTFLLIAIGVLFYVQPAAHLYGYTLNGVDGLNEFRAIYMGFWIGLAILFFTAAWKFEMSILGDMALILVLSQSLARVLSFIIDGKPNWHLVAVFFLEMGTSLIGLMIRPGRIAGAIQN
ncbi:MAG TPA: DUF4345 family protein [Pyrinomonadaceae bacterium]|jgi:hypothetical protein